MIKKRPPRGRILAVWDGQDRWRWGHRRRWVAGGGAQVELGVRGWSVKSGCVDRVGNHRAGGDAGGAGMVKERPRRHIRATEIREPRKA